MLAGIPAQALAQASEVAICDESRQLTVCEQALMDAGLRWEGRAREGRVLLEGCLQKLRVRTSTVINKLVLPPAPGVSTSWKHDAVLMGAAAISGLGLGVVLGVLLTTR